MKVDHFIHIFVPRDLWSVHWQQTFIPEYADMADLYIIDDTATAKDWMFLKDLQIYCGISFLAESTKHLVHKMSSLVGKYAV